MPSSTSIRSFLRRLAIAAAIALTAASCGDDGGTTDGSGDGAGTGADSTDQGAPDDISSGGDEPSDRSGELVGGWDITTFQLAGALGEATPVDTAPASIEFHDDGTFSYANGCNTGEGEWEARGVYQPPNDDDRVVGQAISFDGISQTEIGCDAELADQDLAIGGAIRATDIYTLDNSTVTLWRDGNVMIEGSRS